MKPDVAIIGPFQNKLCCHSNLPGGIQIFWPLFRDLSTDIIHLKFLHFSCGYHRKHIHKYINDVADCLIS